MKKSRQWEEKWKRFLYEGISPQMIAGKQLKKIFKGFHISPQKLSFDDWFTFTPRKPRYPYQDHEGNIIEDNFTPRISVSPTIEHALTAIEGQFIPGEWLHVYAVTEYPDIEAKQEDCPETDDMPYDLNFTMSKWLKNKLDTGTLKSPGDVSIKNWLTNTTRSRPSISPASLPSYLSNEFEFCVPDSDETHESWFLKPTTMVYVGELNPKTQNIILSATGLKMVQKAGLKTKGY